MRTYSNTQRTFRWIEENFSSSHDARKLQEKMFQLITEDIDDSDYVQLLCPRWKVRSGDGVIGPSIYVRPDEEQWRECPVYSEMKEEGKFDGRDLIAMGSASPSDFVTFLWAYEKNCGLSPKYDKGA